MGDVVVVDELKLESARPGFRRTAFRARTERQRAHPQGNDRNLTLASRNLPNVSLATSGR